MKLTCTQQDLAKALAAVRLAIATSTPYSMPILSQVLLTAAAGELTLSGANLEMGVVYTILATVAEEGNATCPAHLLAEFVGTHSPTTMLTLATTETKGLKVTSGRSQVTLRMMDPNDFPAIPTPGADAAVLTLDVAAFRQAVGEVAFAADANGTHPVFTGVLLRVRSGRMILTAADRFRLATRSLLLAIPPTRDDVGDSLVPAAILQKVVKLLPETGTFNLLVSPTGNRLMLRVGETCLIVITLLSGKYPVYEAVIPTTSTTQAVVAAADLQRALRQANVIARDYQQVVLLTLTADITGLTNDSITLSAGDAVLPTREALDGSGDMTATLETTLDGLPLAIRLNTKFLLEVTRALSAPRLRLSFTDEKQPVRITPDGAEKGEKESDYQYVMMPISASR